jgi:hypothetical protein
LKTKTATSTKTLTKAEAKRLVASGRLPREEELVLRMRFGIPIAMSEPLEMMGGGRADIQAQLAAMEKATLSALEEQGAGEKRNRDREKILETLRKLH